MPLLAWLLTSPFFLSSQPTRVACALVLVLLLGRVVYVSSNFPHVLALSKRSAE